MRYQLLCISILCLLLFGCNQQHTVKNKYIETDWYKLNLYKGCIGGYTGSRGGAVSYDSCSYPIEIRQFVRFPFSDQYYTGRFGTIVVNEPIDGNFSYSLEVREDAYDSMVRAYGSSSAFRPLLDSIVLEELTDFLNIEVTLKDSLIQTYYTIVEDSALLASNRVADKLPKNGSTSGASGGGKSGFEVEQDWGSLYQLTDAIASVAERPIRWLNDSLKYKTNYEFRPETDDPWQELQLKIKEEFGLAFVKDSVELEFLIIEFQE